MRVNAAFLRKWFRFALPVLRGDTLLDDQFELGRQRTRLPSQGSHALPWAARGRGHVRLAERRGAAHHHRTNNNQGERCDDGVFTP
jgi:hypothetical protein